MVVLHELQVDPQLGQNTAPVALDKKAALIPVDDRLEQDRPLQVGCQSVHGGGM
jgi:hypothetical protein